jgi:hypothetical protein
MDAIVAMGQADDDLQSLNDMRMYKKVVRLSDITSADGTTILEQFLDRSAPTQPSAHDWPRCDCPSPNQAAFWKRTILDCFANHFRTLVHPLGDWPHDDPPELWEWWHSPALHCIYQSVNGAWMTWTSLGILYGRPIFLQSLTASPTLPIDAVRSSVSV